MTDFQPQQGDKSRLKRDELTLLETKILPTARKWLRTFPNLAHHAVQTLTYWGEELVDDYGRPYKGRVP